MYIVVRMSIFIAMCNFKKKKSKPTSSTRASKLLCLMGISHDQFWISTHGQQELTDLTWRWGCSWGQRE